MVRINQGALASLVSLLQGGGKGGAKGAQKNTKPAKANVVKPGLKAKNNAQVIKPGLKAKNNAQVIKPGLKTKSNAQVVKPGKAKNNVQGKFNGGSAGGWQLTSLLQSLGQLAGKGKGKGGKNSGKNSKFMDKLAKIDAAKKVWVGGLAAKTTWKTLENHFKELCGEKPSVTELLPKGKACLAFKTEDEATNAISVVNNTEVDGKEIQVDVWTQKEKKEKPEGSSKKKKVKSKFAEKVAKSKAAGKVVRGDPKIREKLGKVEPELKVFVGGMSAETMHGALRKHFAEAGCKPHLVNLMGKDRACVSFKTADEASNAVGTMNATELDGATLEVDGWQKMKKD